MNEFANVSLPDNFENVLATMRSRSISVRNIGEVRLAAQANDYFSKFVNSLRKICQNMAQLKALFKDEWESVVGNCDSLLYLGGNEQATHEYISKILLSLIALLLTALTVYADGDPLGTINSLSTFIFSAIKAIGMIMLGFGIVQIGLSLKSHDASQRANGFMTFFGGVVIAFAKEILDLII